MLNAPLAAESHLARRVIVALSIGVVALIALTLYAFPARAAPGTATTLASLNAVLNASAGAFLCAGFVFVRRRQITAHRSCMLIAFALSSLFLVTYLVHHAMVGSVPYSGHGAARVIYFSLLVPHIVLAAAVVPLALLTLYRGWTSRIALHRRVARVTLPIWLFVSLSGVIIYLMLYHL